MSEDEKTVLLAAQPQEIKTESAISISQVNNAEQIKLPSYTVYMGRGIDTRSDIYSLGITLYYIVTGMEPPADFEKRIPIMETGIEISEGFAIILEKMMELKPEDRFQNGMEFYHAIVNCHKLDKRYIAMKRKQTGIMFASLACLFIGILVIFGGIFKIRHDRNSKYYELLQQAELYVTEYEYDAAAGLLEQAKQMESTRITAYKDEVYLLYLSENYDDCIAVAEEYINTHPFVVKTQEDEEEYGDIHYLAANAYFEMEDYVNAANLFEYALQYNHKNGVYYRDYAIALAKMGQLDEAEDYLEEGIERGIEQASVMMVQGEIARAEGSYDDAVDCLLQSIASTSDVSMKKRAVLLAVDTYKAIGDSAVNDEIELLEKYQAEFEEGGTLVLVEYLADAYVRKAATDELNAGEYYEKALSLFMQMYEQGYMTYQLKENMAILYQNMDCFDEAEDILLKMAEEYPQRYEVYKRLAYLEADKQQMKENIDRDYLRMQEYYENALEIYSGKEEDMEMQMLDNMMQELKDGGWL